MNDDNMLSNPWLDTNTRAEIQELLCQEGLISESDQIGDIQPAGAGNMNVTLRVHLTSANGSPSSLIVKQARPYVAKYDSIAAPLERIDYEAAFYDFVRRAPELAARMPRRLAWLPQLHVLVLEDLWPATDATSLYDDHNSVELPPQVPGLVAWLCQLHEFSLLRDRDRDFRNLRLRELNHAHIFAIPFQETPALDLDAVCPGLTAASKTLRCDSVLRDRCAALGKTYLDGGKHLLHGDYYPGSWLLGPSTAFVIDPEFCFAGPAEFDLGILLGHLTLMGCEHAEDQLRALDCVSHLDRDWRWIQDFAAVEILRRLLGVAQLDLSHSLHERVQLIDRAYAQLQH